MGLTEGHWFEDEDQLTERQLESAIADERAAYRRGLRDGRNEVVRCWACKHRPINNRNKEEYEDNGFGIEFPDDRCPCRCEDGWYNWYPPDDWFCANGEPKEM